MKWEELIKKERLEKKERMKSETVGVHIIFYLAAIFHVFVSTLYGYQTDDSAAQTSVFWYLVLGTVICYIAFNLYLYRVRENGHYYNIFRKYRYIPIDLKRLFLAKAVIAGRNMLGLSLLGQSASLLIVIANPGNEGASLSQFHVWLPCLAGGIAFVYFLLLMGSWYIGAKR